MFTSLLIAVAIWGTDPQDVFSGVTTPLANPVSRSGPQQPVPRDNTIPSVIGDQSIFRPDVVRGQSIPDDLCPQPCDTALESFIYHPFVQEFMSAMNPFHDEPVVRLLNYYDPYGMQMGVSSTGQQGYRLGWSTFNELTEMPYAAARGATGNFSSFEWNSYLRYAHVVRPGVLFQGTGYFNARWWEGPGSVAVPGQVDQVSTDLQLSFFNDGPWSGQVAFHPQIVQTYEAPLDWNAFNFDGRAFLMYKSSPEWSFVGGFAIWDRVDKLIIPYGGVVWNDNDRWEVRLLFPKSRVSYFLGNWNNADHWFYGTAEYSAESYQSFDKETAYSDRIQITDDRLCLGYRTDKGRYSYFFEGGWVFNRQVKFAGSTPNFNLDDTALIRVGLVY